LTLARLIGRTTPAVPWQDGDNIPWHEPGFSERMLREHLSQDHDAASRRFDTIEAHVDWIHHHLLRGRPTRVLDLGCGPGLYTSRLARLGHHCLGIDYSPASINYATDSASKENLSCDYLREDIRRAEYGTGFDFVMLIFGEFNVFRLSDAKSILRKANDALTEGGLLLLEPHTDDYVRSLGARSPHWYSRDRGVFSDDPHVCLQEHFWDEAAKAATVRYYILEAAGGVTTYAQSYQAYSDDEYRSVLADCGFSSMEMVPSLNGAASKAADGLMVVVARMR
jgi:SAM-dependent methyltransferase